MADSAWLVRTMKFTRLDFYQNILYFPGTTQKPGDSSAALDRDLAKSSSAPSPFRRLPKELVDQILDSLDFGSLANLALTNAECLRAVGSLPAFRDVGENATDTLRALARTKRLAFVTAAELHTALCSPWCGFCNVQFGSCLFLLTCTRCCLSCLYKDPRCAVLADPRAYIGLAHDLRDLASDAGLHSLLAIPGKFGIGALEFLLKPTRLFGVERAIQLWRQNNPDKSHVSLEKVHVNRLLATHVPVFRSSAVTPFPFFDKKAGRAQTGTFCRGCMYELHLRPGDRERSWSGRGGLGADVAHLEEEFPAHVSRCPGVQRLVDMYTALHPDIFANSLAET